MRPLTLALLGCFQARLADGQTPQLPKKTQAMLAYLGLRPGQAHARDILAALLWGESGNKQARKSLRQAIHVLRKSLPAQVPALIVKGETIALNANLVEVDAATFEQLVAERSAKALEQAALLYRGELLEGFNINEAGFEEWLIAERERLRELALQGLGILLSQEISASQTERAVQTAVKLLAIDPLQEHVHRALMRLYARQGRRAAALKQYQRCVDALRRELGTPPEHATRQLYADLLRQRLAEPARAVPDPTATQSAERVKVNVRPEAQNEAALFIGREQEISQLCDCLEEALNRKGHVIAIAGEAGIGKSSLLDALASVASARGARTLLGRCHETEQGLALTPWVEALRSARLRADLDDTAASTSAHHRRIFDAFTEFVRSLASSQPVLVMLEDLQWADEMTLRILAFVAHRIRDSRVLLVLTYRDDELAELPVLSHVIDELRREDYFVELSLPPLRRTAAVALAGSLFGADLPRFANLDEPIWRASEGNPFIIVETVRALQKHGPTVAPRDLPLPETVRRLMAARLRRLSERGRHLASVAATIGLEFDFALLEHASGLTEPDAADVLEELVRCRLLRGVGPRFQFSHARLREVVYELLLPPRRKMLHAQVACALEELPAASELRHNLTIAQHYGAAALWDKALFHSRRAAIDLGPSLRNALIPLAEHGDISGCARSAESLKPLDDQQRLGWLTIFASRLSRTNGFFTEAREFAEAAQSVGDSLGDFWLRFGSRLELGAAHLALGDFRQAAALFQELLGSCEQDLKWPPARSTARPALLARTRLARSLTELGDFDEALRHAEDSLRVARALDDWMSLTYAYVRLGRVHAARGELDQAAQQLERARELARVRSTSFTAAIVAADLGHVYTHMGSVSDGLGLLREAQQAYASGRLQTGKTRVFIQLADAYLEAGQLADARGHAEAALVNARERGQRGYEAYALQVMAAIGAANQHPDLDQVAAEYRQSMTIATGLGMRPLVAQLHRGLSMLDRSRGQTFSGVARQYSEV